MMSLEGCEGVGKSRVVRVKVKFLGKGKVVYLQMSIWYSGCLRINLLLRVFRFL